MTLAIPALVLTFAITGVFWWWSRVFFYRDPLRTPPGSEKKIVAPCDGKVIYCYEVTDGVIISNKLGRPIEVKEILKMDLPEKWSGTLLGIYMSPKDVHFNYAPLSGEIISIHQHQTGLNLPMVDLWEYVQFVWLNHWVNLFGNKYHLENERTSVHLKARFADLVLVEIADIFVNKISLFVKPGDHIQQGVKTSFIERGSQVDMLIVSPGHEIVVELGTHVTGGETVLALLHPGGSP